MNVGARGAVANAMDRTSFASLLALLGALLATPSSSSAQAVHDLSYAHTNPAFRIDSSSGPRFRPAPQPGGVALAAMDLRASLIHIDGRVLGRPQPETLDPGSFIVRAGQRALAPSADLTQRSSALHSMVALPGGGAVVGMTHEPMLQKPAYIGTGRLVAVDADGNVRWQLAPTHHDSPWVELEASPATDGTLYFSGWFRRGTLQLPGQSRWRGRRHHNGFAGQLDPSTGRILWAARLPGNAGGARGVGDGEILFTISRGRANARDIVVARMTRGRISQRIRVRTEHDDYVAGLHAFADGSFVLLHGHRVGQTESRFASHIGPGGEEIACTPVPGYATMASGSGPVASILGHGAIERPSPRSPSLTDRVAVIDFHQDGTRSERWYAPPTEGRWVWSNEGAGVGHGSTWIGLNVWDGQRLRAVVADARTLPAASPIPLGPHTWPMPAERPRRSSVSSDPLAVIW